MEEKEELIRAWIGKKHEKLYNKVMNGGFSIAAACIPDLYLLTRKMYLETAIYIIIAIIVECINKAIFKSETSSWIFILAFKIATGFAFYPVYKMWIFRKIKKYENKGLTHEEQIKIAHKKGGDQVTIAVIVAVIIYIVVIFFGLAIFNMANQYYTGEVVTQENVIQNNDGTAILEKNEFTLTYDTNKWKATIVKNVEEEAGTVLRYNGTQAYIAALDESYELNNFDSQDFLDTINENKEYTTKIMNSIAQANDLEVSGEVETKQIKSGVISLEVGVVAQENSGYGRIYCIMSEETNKMYVILVASNNYITQDMEEDAEEVIETIKFKNDEDLNLYEEESEEETSTDITDNTYISQNSSTTSEEEKLGNLKYKISSDLSSSEYNDETNKTYYNENIDAIYMSYDESEYYDSISDYMSYITAEEEGVIENGIETINTKNWNKIVIKNEYGTQYYYVIEYKGKIYEIEFSIEDNELPTEFENVKNSLEF